MKLVLASRNKHKIKEWEATLARFVEGVELLSLDEVGITEDIEENGTTFEANALLKAQAAARSGYPSIGEDSGLEVHALGGEPGVYSARYAGEHGNDRANNALLLEKLHALGAEDRSASFVCAIACVMPDGEQFFCRGEAPGVIIDEYRGEGGFGYDPLFYVPELGKTFAEMTAAEKNSISHRGRAIELFAEKLNKLKRG